MNELPKSNHCASETLLWRKKGKRNCDFLFHPQLKERNRNMFVELHKIDKKTGCYICLAQCVSICQWDQPANFHFYTANLSLFHIPNAIFAFWSSLLESKDIQLLIYIHYKLRIKREKFRFSLTAEKMTQFLGKVLQGATLVNLWSLMIMIQNRSTC